MNLNSIILIIYYYNKIKNKKLIYNKLKNNSNKLTNF